MQTVDMGQGEGMLLAGDGEGQLFRVFFKLPQVTYTEPRDIQVCGRPQEPYLQVPVLMELCFAFEKE